MKAQGLGFYRGLLVFLVLPRVAHWAKCHPMRHRFAGNHLNL
jgi:hypothetical protein